jgi:GDP-L-galactose phosphorylase
LTSVRTLQSSQQVIYWHFVHQAYYLKVQYPVEKATTEKLTSLGNGVSIFHLVDYPVSGFLFEGGASLEDLSDVVSKVCIFLQENNRPFNVLISESGKRVFLLPQVLLCNLSCLLSSEL